MDGVGVLRDFAVAEAVLHLEAGRKAPSRVLMVDPDGRVFMVDLDVVPAGERSPEVLRGALRSLWSVGVPVGFVLLMPAAADVGRSVGFCAVTHDGLGVEGEAFVLRDGRFEVVRAPASVMESGILVELERAWAVA